MHGIRPLSIQQQHARQVNFSMASTIASAPFSPAANTDPQGIFTIYGRCCRCLLAKPFSGHTVSSQRIDPVSVLLLYSAKLAGATIDPLWLADQLFGEGILGHQIKHELETTEKPAFEKATRLWGEVATAVEHSENPTQTLLTVCHVMKQRRELVSLAKSIISQVRPQGKKERS